MTDYESIDFFTDKQVLEDPFPYLEYLRAKCPVQPIGHRGVVAVTGAEEAITIYRDNESFSNCNTASGPFLTFPVPLDGGDVGEIIGRYRDLIPQNNAVVTMDPPAHTRERALLMRLITPKRMKENEAFIRRLADRQLDAIVGSGHCEVVNEYAKPYTMLVIADLLGVPEADHQRFREGFGVHTEEAPPADGAGGPGPADVNSLSWLYEWFAAYVEERRREPRSDVLTELALAKYPDGTTPEVMAVVHQAAFLFAAGRESAADLLATAMKYLAEYPELQDEMRADHQRITDFIEECLRIDAPVNVDFRLAKRETTVAGVLIAPGTPVMILPGAANRDPRRFEDPEEFRLQRPNVLQHLAFGKGIHTCPGASLARAEAQIMIERFVERTRDIRLSAKYHGPPDARRFNYEPALSRRALHALHIEFDDAAAG